MRRAGLRPADAARLMGVSVSTVMRWLDQTHEPASGRYEGRWGARREQAARALDGIVAAVQAGRLPLDPTLAQRDAQEALDGVCRKYVARGPRRLP